MIEIRDSSLLLDSCLVDGAWVKSVSKKTMKVTNPATGAEVGEVPELSKSEIEIAIASAYTSQKHWAQLPARERSAVLRSWFNLILENVEDLAVIMTVEQGKPIAEARGEIIYAASFVEWFAEEAKRTYGDIVPSPLSNSRISVLKQPVGVIAAITPWNFPAAMITRKVAPALAAGCSIIVRPADLTPLTALALAKLAQRAGVPRGVLQVVTGVATEVGSVLTSSPYVRKLSFTGSTEVGRLLMAQCATTIKRLSLELGGNAPFIVFDDADIDAAVDGLMVSKFRNAGQTCVCANRILVQRKVFCEFVTKLKNRVDRLRVGNGMDPETNIGPMISERALAKIEEHIRDAVSKGAQLVTGGNRLGGLFFKPAIVTGVTSQMTVSHEETFGPLASIFVFDTEEEAIEMANDTIYGLAAYFYSRDHSRGIRVAEALEFGIVGHNTGMISNEVAPFGGIKQSGIGREGSRYGIDEYLELKYISTAISLPN